MIRVVLRIFVMTGRDGRRVLEDAPSHRAFTCALGWTPLDTSLGHSLVIRNHVAVHQQLQPLARDDAQ